MAGFRLMSDAVGGAGDFGGRLLDLDHVDVANTVSLIELAHNLDVLKRKRRELSGRTPGALTDEHETAGRFQRAGHSSPDAIRGALCVILGCKFAGHQALEIDNSTLQCRLRALLKLDRRIAGKRLHSDCRSNETCGNDECGGEISASHGHSPFFNRHAGNAISRGELITELCWPNETAIPTRADDCLVMSFTIYVSSIDFRRHNRPFGHVRCGNLGENFSDFLNQPRHFERLVEHRRRTQ